MKIKSIRYGRTVSKDFNSKKAEYELDVEPGDDPVQVLEVAKALVASALGEVPPKIEIDRAKEIIAQAEAIQIAASKLGARK